MGRVPLGSVPRCRRVKTPRLPLHRKGAVGVHLSDLPGVPVAILGEDGLHGLAHLVVLVDDDPQSPSPSVSPSLVL